jgi:signal transduction histidine kinase
VQSDEKGLIIIELTKDNTSVTLKIKDNGRGIDNEMKEKIFSPNFTTKSSGMGLGLAIVKSIIETNKGEIWFVSEEGKGTEFYIKFTKA